LIRLVFFAEINNAAIVHFCERDSSGAHEVRVPSGEAAQV
jgi:hypothetical protein